MAMAGRLRSSLPLLRRAIADSADRSAASKALLANPVISSRSYATASPPAKQQNVKIPVSMFGVSANYASALYLAAVKANILDKVQAEVLSFVEASKKSPTFSLFMKDPSVKKDSRVQAINEICEQAKYAELTKNFLAVVAENGRLGYLNRISERFLELTMAHRGEVEVTVTSVIALPAEQEKELMETLHEFLGQGKTPKVQQKVDPSIMGGLIIEFGNKVFDMSIRTRAQQMERFLRQPANLE